MKTKDANKQHCNPKYGNLGQIKRPFDANKYISKAIEAEQVMEMKKGFDLFDRDSNGWITIYDLRQTINQLQLGFQARHIYHIIEPLDPDKPTKIDFDEFFYIFTIGQTQLSNISEISHIFSMFDRKRTGFLTLNDLIRGSKELGFCVSKQKLQEMLDVADIDRDGVISLEDFYQTLAKNKWNE